MAQKAKKAAPVRHGTLSPILFRSESGAYHTSVTLSKPADDEVCPISLEEMRDYHLDFLPGCTFRKGHPDCKKMSMQCGHSFSAMALVYHFRKRSLSCPMCRQGTEERLHAACIPFHFKPQMLLKIAQDEKHDKEEQEREDYATAMDFFTTDVSAGAVVIREMLNHVDLLLYFYSGDSLYPCMMQQYSMASQSTWEGTESSVSFRLPPHYARQLRSNMRQLHEPSQLVFSLTARDFHGHVVQLDRGNVHSNVLMERRTNDVDAWSRRVETQQDGSALRVGFLQGQGNSPPEIESLEWTVPKTVVSSELFDQPLAAARAAMQSPRSVLLVMEA